MKESKKKFVETAFFGSQGITLIALIVTIIILLILAGVTIATLTGETGLIYRAEQAVEKTQEKSADEQVKMAISVSMMNEKGKIDLNVLNEELKKIKGLTYKEQEISDENKITELPEIVEINGKDFEITGTSIYNGNEEEDDKIYEQQINYTMLFDGGDECIDITGGWYRSDYRSNGNACTKNTDHISYSYANLTGGSSGLYPAKPIDITDYKGFCAKIYGKYSSSYPNCLGIAATWDFSHAAGLTYAARAGGERGQAVTNIGNNETKILSMDFNDALKSHKLICPLAYVSSMNAAELRIYSMFLYKEDDWKTWLSKANLSTEVFSSLNDVFGDSNALTTLLNSEKAVDFMIKQGTGEIMVNAIQSEAFLTALNSSPYKNMIEENEHWNKILNLADF